MLKQKRAALPTPKASSAPSQQNVVSLMDALKRSLAAEEGNAPKAFTKSKPKKPVAGQREMLLPISGKGSAKIARRKRQRSPPDMGAVTGRQADPAAPAPNRFLAAIAFECFESSEGFESTPSGAFQL